MSIFTKTAIDSIKRSPFQAFSAIFVMAMTFLFATIVAVLVYASDKSLTYFETRPQIIAFIKNGSSDEAIKRLETSLSQDDRIKDVKFVSKEEALEIYKEATSDNPLLAELVSPNIFPASLEFSVSDLNLATSVIEDIKKDEVVEQIGFTANIGSEKSLDEVLNRLQNIGYYVRLFGMGFVSVLGLISFIILTIIISMRMTMRKNEMEILTLIGATNSFVKKPVFIEAVIYSISGVLLGWVIALTIWLYISPVLFGYFGDIPILPRDPVSFFTLFLIILAAEIFVGLLMSWFGSFIAVNRAIKKK